MLRVSRLPLFHRAPCVCEYLIMIVIIAYGNTLRRDDGAGVFLGGMLRGALKKNGREVNLIEVHQLTPELSIPIAEEGVSSVVFVDTRVAEEGKDNFDLRVTAVSTQGGRSGCGHHLDPASVMAYARVLYGKWPPAWLLTVPGVDFQHGEGFSAFTQQALLRLPHLLASLPREWPDKEGPVS